jgi:hypothetical protein
MAKKNETITAAVRKNTPKVTNAQKRMTPDELAAWKVKIGFDKLDAATQASIIAKLAAPATVRNGAKAVKAYDVAWVKGLTIIQFLCVKGLIANEDASRADEKAAFQAKITAQIEALQKSVALA